MCDFANVECRCHKSIPRPPEGVGPAGWITRRAWSRSSAFAFLPQGVRPLRGTRRSGDAPLREYGLSGDAPLREGAAQGACRSGRKRAPPRDTTAQGIRAARGTRRSGDAPLWEYGRPGDASLRERAAQEPRRSGRERATRGYGRSANAPLKEHAAQGHARLLHPISVRLTRSKPVAKLPICSFNVSAS